MKPVWTIGDDGQLHREPPLDLTPKLRRACPHCHGVGFEWVEPSAAHIALAKEIDPGAWSLNGSARRREYAIELADRQFRSAIEE